MQSLFDTATAAQIKERIRRLKPSSQRQWGKMIDRFSMGGPQGCTKQAHTFFGPLTPDEWAQLMYKTSGPSSSPIWRIATDSCGRLLNAGSAGSHKTLLHG
jgi:hypothetical protein